MVIQKSKNNAMPLIKYTFIFHSNVLDSPHREMINDGIMKLQTEGIIENIMEKWVRYSERNCEKETDSISTLNIQILKMVFRSSTQSCR